MKEVPVQENRNARLQALKAAAYDTLVQIEQLQAQLRQLNGLIAEETRALQAAAAPNGSPTPAEGAVVPS